MSVHDGPEYAPNTGAADQSAIDKIAERVVAP